MKTSFFEFTFLNEFLFLEFISLYSLGDDQILICECGELVRGDTFKAYIKTAANPSTRTVGHRNCGLIFNFIDEKNTKNYSSRKELKILAGKFAEKNLSSEYAAQFLLEVDRLKSRGRLHDSEILVRAYRQVLELDSQNPVRKKA